MSLLSLEDAAAKRWLYVCRRSSWAPGTSSENLMEMPAVSTRKIGWSCVCKWLAICVLESPSLIEFVRCLVRSEIVVLRFWSPGV